MYFLTIQNKVIEKNKNNSFLLLIYKYQSTWFLLWLSFFYLDANYNMEQVEYADELLEKKREKKRIYNQTQKERKKENKRKLIEKIKEERISNSLIFGEF